MSRKRLFEIDEALDVAMRSFRKNGYEGTSVSDICEIIGISKPALYRVFRSKDELFQCALERCGQQDFRFVRNALRASTAADVVLQFFGHLIEAITQPNLPPGSFLLSAAVAYGPRSTSIRTWLAGWRANLETALARRFSKAVRDGDLDEQVSPYGLARYVMSVSTGLALQAEAGASRSALHEIANIALQAFLTARSNDRALPTSLDDGRV